MFVRNNEPRLTILNGTDGVKVRLMPGVNVVKDEHWENVAKTKGAQTRLAKRSGRNAHPHLEVLAPELDPVAAPKESDEIDPSPTLAGVKAKDAIDLIEGTFDQKLLESWVNSDGRPSVLNALEKQLDKLAKHVKPEKE